MHLPFVTAKFELHGPTPSTTVTAPPKQQGEQAAMHVGPVAIPSPGKTAYYVGLGALAVVQLVEWPIAAAIAAGTYVAQHTRVDRSAMPKPTRAARAEIARGRAVVEQAGHATTAAASRAKATGTAAARRTATVARKTTGTGGAATTTPSRATPARGTSARSTSTRATPTRGSTSRSATGRGTTSRGTTSSGTAARGKAGSS